MEICNLLGATCRVRRPRRTAAATAARNPRKNLFLPSLCTIIKWYILPAFRHFLFIWKRKRLQKKSKLRPQKGKQASLKSKSFCAMLRKKRLKCGRIPARFFLDCHQKSNTFKCKQFCCAKPMCAYLSVGYAPRPRQRHAAVHSSRLSISCSAHSSANAPELERMRARASCFASRSLACLNWLIKHCGAAMENMIIEVNWSLSFTLLRLEW